MLFSMVAAPISIPAHKECMRAPFTTPSLTLAVSRLFDNSHPDRGEVIASCGFDLHSPDD